MGFSLDIYLAGIWGCLNLPAVSHYLQYFVGFTMIKLCSVKLTYQLMGFDAILSEIQ
jgi:hypothetical protein